MPIMRSRVHDEKQEETDILRNKYLAGEISLVDIPRGYPSKRYVLQSIYPKLGKPSGYATRTI
jgi:hypothetical protein